MKRSVFFIMCVQSINVRWIDAIKKEYRIGRRMESSRGVNEEEEEMNATDATLNFILCKTKDYTNTLK